jgi:hypothetical protein
MGDGTSLVAVSNNVHECTFGTGGAGIVCGQGVTLAFNIIANISGTADGIQSEHDTVIMNNTVVNVGRDCLRNTSFNNMGLDWRLNIFASAANGLNFQGGVVPADSTYDGNAYFNCRKNRVNCDAVTGQNAYLPYKNVYDVLLGSTISPFTNAAAKDYSLANNVSGNACRNGIAMDQDSTPGDNFTFMGAQGQLALARGGVFFR